MSISIEERRVLSVDKSHALFVKIYIPENPIGFLHIVHGMTEHIRRYDFMMNYYAEKGYIVFGYDHLGHGYSVKSDDELGYIGHNNGWQLLISDVSNVQDKIRKIYDPHLKLPYYLLGHSMGSFIVRMVVHQNPTICDKLIAVGTGGPNPAAGIGLFLAKLIRDIKGERHLSPLLYKLAFGSYNSHFNEGDIRDWLTKDKQIKEMYSKDKYCNFMFSSSAMADLIKLNKESNSGAWFKSFPKSLPTLFISGQEDPVGDYGKGVQKVYNKLVKKGCNVEIKLFEDCRHEIHNDTSRDEMFNIIEDFLTK